MHSYEAMFIFKPDLQEQEQKTLVGKLEKLLKENQAVIKSSQVFGKRSLAYGIKKSQEGLYYLINFSAQEGGVVLKLKQMCKINENVLRTFVVKKEAKAQSQG